MLDASIGNAHVFFDDDDEFVEVRPGMRRRVVVGEDLSVWLWKIHESVGPTGLHHHEQSEQLGYVAAGTLEFQIGDDTRRVLPAGSFYLAPKNVVHGGSTFTGDPDKNHEVWIVDVFAPPRLADYDGDRTETAPTNGTTP